MRKTGHVLQQALHIFCRALAARVLSRCPRRVVQGRMLALVAGQLEVLPAFPTLPVTRVRRNLNFCATSSNSRLFFMQLMTSAVHVTNKKRQHRLHNFFKLAIIRYRRYVPSKAHPRPLEDVYSATKMKPSLKESPVSMSHETKETFISSLLIFRNHQNHEPASISIMYVVRKEAILLG